MNQNKYESLNWALGLSLTGSVVASAVASGVFGTKIWPTLQNIDNDQTLAEQEKKQKLDKLLQGPFQTMQKSFYVFFALCAAFLLATIAKMVLSYKQGRAMSKAQGTEPLAQPQQQPQGSKTSNWLKALVGVQIFESGLPFILLAITISAVLLLGFTAKASFQYESGKTSDPNGKRGVKNVIVQCAKQQEKNTSECLGDQKIKDFRKSMLVNMILTAILGFFLLWALIGPIIGPLLHGASIGLAFAKN